VWISPVTSQEQKVTADLSSYHGYWQTDLYNVNSAFGTKNDLKALSDALHSRGMVWFLYWLDEWPRIDLI
jgi:alpha-amylase